LKKCNLQGMADYAHYTTDSSKQSNGVFSLKHILLDKLFSGKICMLNEIFVMLYLSVPVV